jgi:polyhydroxyalkanoate synthase
MSKTRQERNLPAEEIQESVIQFWHDAAKYTQLMHQPPDIEVGATHHEVVYEKDRMKLLHYTNEAKVTKEPPVLMVYAVINKPYVLDLQPDRSVIRAFLKKGFDVYLIDWGTPRNSDKFVDTGDYVERYIDRAVDWVRENRGTESVSLFGYCLGGTLAAIYAAIHPDKVRNLMVMAGPIDFNGEYGLLHQWTGEEYINAEKMVKAYGNIPEDLFTSIFKFLNPIQTLNIKYMTLYENVQNDRFVDMFLRMEKWIHDGIPVTGAFYRDLIEKWYQGNHIVKNKLRIDGHKVNLKNIGMPVITISGQYDHIVPPVSTESIFDYISSKDTKAVNCSCGHIGLSVGSRAHREVWPEVTDWLSKRSRRGKKKRSRA